MRRLIVGITGASGVVYGIRMLEVLREVPDVESHLIMSTAARETIALETDWRPADVEGLADVSYRFNDVAAALSSGSYRVHGMIVIPCSMGTLSAIAWSASDNLLTRAADVTLKERRRLVLVPRETPLHLGHLRLMTQLAEIGAVICPPVPAFYQRPKTIEHIIDHTINRLFDLLAIELPRELSTRWEGPPARSRGRAAEQDGGSGAV